MYTCILTVSAGQLVAIQAYRVNKLENNMINMYGYKLDSHTVAYII